MRKIAISMLFFFLLVGWNHRVQAQEIPRVVDILVTHRFGENIHLEATLESELDIHSLTVVFASRDNPNLAKDLVNVSPEGKVVYTLNISQQPIRAFTEIEISFVIALVNGTSITTEVKKYYYDDNRFDWQIQQSEAFTVYWYQDDPELGTKIIEAADEGWERIQNQFDVPPPGGIHIYVYNNVVDMQDTLMVSGSSSYWIAGHAVSDLGVILVSLPPGPEQSLEIRRQIPHELLHILLYRKLGPGYSNLPRWLNEGLASMAELFPNPDYQILLERAYEREALIPIRDLCASFPIDAASFQLSYAQSYAFTWYLQQTYGNDKIEALIQSYASGLVCEQGTEPVFERSLSVLEAEWRQVAFDEGKVLGIWLDSLPLLILVGFAFIAPVAMMIFRAGRRHTPSSNQPSSG